MKIVKDPITISEIKKMAEDFSGDFVKAVVDIEKEIMAVDAELHADLREFLMEKENSKPNDMWGINLYPSMPESDFIEFDSMVNIKPWLGNRTRGIDDESIKGKIRAAVKKLVK